MLYAFKVFKYAYLQIVLVFLFSLERKKKQKSSSTAWSLRASVRASASTLPKVQLYCQVYSLVKMMLLAIGQVLINRPVAFGITLWTAWSYLSENTKADT